MSSAARSIGQSAATGAASKEKEPKEKEKEKRTKQKLSLSSSQKDPSDGDHLDRSGHTSDASSGDERDPQRDRIVRIPAAASPASSSPPTLEFTPRPLPIPPSTLLMQIVLPAEVVLMIFGYLAEGSLLRCAKVCRDWRAISEDDSLWSRLCALKWPELNPQVMARPRSADGKVTAKQKISGRLEGTWQLEGEEANSKEAREVEQAAAAAEAKRKEKRDRKEAKDAPKYVHWKRRFLEQCFPLGKRGNSVRIRCDRNLFVSGRPGQMLSGEVYVRLTAPLRVQGIFLRFIGVEEAGIVNLQAKERYRVQRDVLFQRWQTLVGPVPWAARETADVQLTPRFSVLPFALEVPVLSDPGEALPASFFHLDFRCEYKVSVFLPSIVGSSSQPVVNPETSIDTHYSLGILPVYDHSVLLNSLPLTTAANADPLFGRGDVVVKATIPRTIFVVNETINVEVEIQNNSNRAVKNVRIVLDANVKSVKGTTRTSHLGKVSQVYDQISIEPKQKFNGILHFTFPCVPPSIHFGKYFHFYYALNVDVSPSMSMNPVRVLFPITVLGDNCHVDSLVSSVPLSKTATTTSSS